MVASDGTDHDRLDVTVTVTDVDEMQPADFDPLAEYDANDSGKISRRTRSSRPSTTTYSVWEPTPISKDDVIETINLYLFG